MMWCSALLIVGRGDHWRGSWRRWGIGYHFGLGVTQEMRCDLWALAMGSAGIAASAGCCARRAAFAAAVFAAALRATWRLTRVFVVSLRGGSLNFIHGSRLSYSNQS